MKAKEYAAQYKASPTGDTLASIVFAMIKEAGQLSEARHSRSDAAMVSILNELNLKWLAFCRMTGDPQINENGFKEALKLLVPESYSAWQKLVQK